LFTAGVKEFLAVPSDGLQSSEIFLSYDLMPIPNPPNVILKGSWLKQAEFLFPL